MEQRIVSAAVYCGAIISLPRPAIEAAEKGASHEDG